MIGVPTVVMRYARSVTAPPVAALVPLSQAADGFTVD